MKREMHKVLFGPRGFISTDFLVECISDQYAKEPTLLIDILQTAISNGDVTIPQVKAFHTESGRQVQMRDTVKDAIRHIDSLEKAVREMHSEISDTRKMLMDNEQSIVNSVHELNKQIKDVAMETELLAHQLAGLMLRVESKINEYDMEMKAVKATSRATFKSAKKHDIFIKTTEELLYGFGASES